MTSYLRLPSLFLLVPVLCALVARAAEPDLTQHIAASDAHFVYEGRFDQSHPEQPVVIWQTSRIRIGFTGDAVAVRFGDLQGQVFFNATVDGRTTVLRLPEHSTERRFELAGYGEGAHQLTLFKRSEAAAGHVAFLGIDVAPGAAVRAGQVPKDAAKLLFIGDSITVGACNEDGPKDQWEDRSTHNAAKSWAALTAAALHADHRNIAVSGMGISIGWVPQLAGDTWDRVYPEPTALQAQPGDWRPDVIFVNFGENDSSRVAALKQPFPPSFTERYIRLIHAIRAMYPQAEIVALRGGMSGGANNPDLRQAWEAAVSELEHTDPKVAHFVFKHWSEQHPRVADDQAMADELAGWLRMQPFVPGAAKK